MEKCNELESINLQPETWKKDGLKGSYYNKLMRTVHLWVVQDKNTHFMIIQLVTR